jgi:hypothetical protein
MRTVRPGRWPEGLVYQPEFIGAAEETTLLAHMTGEGRARNDWQHSIPAVEALRYSITFRTLRRTK